MRIQNIIPLNVRKYLLRKHQSFLWSRAIKEYSKIIEAGIEPSKKLIKKLVYAWGNQGFSAKNEYLETCIQYAFHSKGLILECGSGLSTILIGFIAKKQDRQMISFEHIDFWAEKIKKELNEYSLMNNQLYVRNLINYGDYDWYDVGGIEIGIIELCICDAPPSNTKGGRRGFFNIYRNQLHSNSIILVDDTIRRDEQQMIQEWEKEMNLSVEFKGKSDFHAVIKIK